MYCVLCGKANRIETVGTLYEWRSDKKHNEMDKNVSKSNASRFRIDSHWMTVIVRRFFRFLLRKRGYALRSRNNLFPRTIGHATHVGKGAREISFVLVCIQRSLYTRWQMKNSYCMLGSKRHTIAMATMTHGRHTKSQLTNEKFIRASTYDLDAASLTALSFVNCDWGLVSVSALCPAPNGYIFRQRIIETEHSRPPNPLTHSKCQIP